MKTYFVTIKRDGKNIPFTNSTDAFEFAASNFESTIVVIDSQGNKETLYVPNEIAIQVHANFIMHEGRFSAAIMSKRNGNPKRYIDKAEAVEICEALEVPKNLLIYFSETIGVGVTQMRVIGQEP